MSLKFYNSDIWTSLEPIYIVLTWILIAQFSVKGKCNNRVFTLIGYRSWYKIASCLLTIIALSVVIYTTKIYWKISKNIVLKFLGILKVYNCLSLFAVSIIFASTSGPQAIEMLKTVVGIDAKIVKLGFSVDNKFARKINIAFLVCYLIMFLTGNIYDHCKYNNEILSTAIIYSMINSYLYLISILFRSWFFVLGQRFSILNSCIENLSTDDVSSVQNLRDMEWIFQDLCIILKGATSTRSITMLFHLIMNFTIISIQCFLFYMVYHNKAQNISMQLFLYSIIDTLLIVICGNNIKEKVKL